LPFVCRSVATFQHHSCRPTTNTRPLFFVLPAALDLTPT